jgi:signal peptidase
MKKLSQTIYYSFLVIIGAITVLFIVSAFPITGNIKFMVVQSGSMEPSIRAGSVVMVKPVEDYKSGDVITFGPYSKTKPPTSHRIYDIKVVDGQSFYITKGDANNAPDLREIIKKDILGKVLVSVPYLGFAVDFAKKPIGFALIIIIPAAIIVSDEIKNIWKEIIKLKNKKKDNEQDKEITKLKEEIDKFKKPKDNE